MVPRDAGFLRPMRCFRRVLFPLPLPPMITKISPFRTWKESPSITTQGAVGHGQVPHLDDGGIVHLHVQEDGQPVDDGVGPDDEGDAQ
jgi:hypothetical protein